MPGAALPVELRHIFHEAVRSRSVRWSGARLFPGRLELAVSEGLEPPTPWFVARCSHSAELGDHTAGMTLREIGAGEAGGTPSARFSRASADLLARSLPPTWLRTCGWLCRRTLGDLACARHPQGPYWRPVSRPRMDPRPSDPGAPAEAPDFSPRRATRGMRPCSRMENGGPYRN